MEDDLREEIKGGRPALGIAQAKYDGALNECGGNGYGEKIISHLRTSWG